MHYSPTHDKPRKKYCFHLKSLEKWRNILESSFLREGGLQKIAVIGATGTIGSKIAAELENAVTR